MNYKGNTGENTIDKPKSICPLCNSPENSVSNHFKIKDCLIHLGIYSDSQNYKELQVKIRDLWSQDNAYFLKCKNCDLHFAYPFTSGDSEFYNLIYEDESEYGHIWKWEFKITYRILEEIINEGGNANDMLLEIGAGNGSFIRKISESLIAPKNIVATEYSEYGRKKIEGMNVKCLSSDFKEMLTDKYIDKFKYICMFQVLEHLDSLDVVFRSLNRLLTIGGSLFITVPNRIPRLHFEKSGIFEDIPPVHISRWGLNSFRFIESRYGFQIEDYRIQQTRAKRRIRRFIKLKYNTIKARNRILRKASNENKSFPKYLTFLLIVLRYFKPIACLLFKKDMGIAQWVHLKKVANLENGDAIMAS